MPTSHDSFASALSATYRVERELGVGGMATVFLAHDVKHDRDVAIKVLHPDLGAALGAERFLSEIHTTAKLQHPHILPLLDSGSVIGANGPVEWLYYVMPLVTGETLRARLMRERQLPIAECVRIAREVASALDYAHRHGVVHRDIKPENILLHDGSALVADFGIALAVQSAGGQRMTQTGISLGTPQYMSPEQAMGERSVDARSDIYSLGAVTYEMLTGEPPFTGATVQAIVAKVQTEHPVPVRTTRELVPAELEHAVLTALAKLPADRFSTAAEFSTALTDHATTAAPVTSKTAVATRSRLRDPLVLILGASCIALAVSTGVLANRQEPEPFPFRMELNTGDVGVVGEAVIAPDGNSVAFLGRSAACETRCLFAQRLDQSQARLLPGTQGASNPTFSSDGKWLAFVANNNTLKRVPLDGGDAVVVSPVSDGDQIAWTATNELLSSDIDRGGEGILRVSVAGGERTQITRVDTSRHELSHQSPYILPDGRTFVLVIWMGALTNAELGIASLDDPTVKRLNIVGTRAVGYVDGHLLYNRSDGVVMAVPFDIRKRRASGAAVPVLNVDRSFSSAGTDASAVRFNENGGAVFGIGSPVHRLVWVDRAGNAKPAFSDIRDFNLFRISPNGRLAAVVERRGSTADIWIGDVAGRTLTRLTTTGRIRNCAWSSDSRTVYYTSEQSGQPAIWSQAVDGSAPATMITTPRRNPWSLDVSPDGRTAVFSSLDDKSWDLFTIGLDPAGTERPFATSPDYTENRGRFSPSGRELLYTSEASGRTEIYVRPFGAIGSRVPVSTGGSNDAVWSRDGNTIYYREGKSMFAAALVRDPSLRVAYRTKLFSGDFRWDDDDFSGDFEVDGDGSRFLTKQPMEERGYGRKLVVVPNWRTELRRRVQPRAP